MGTEAIKLDPKCADAATFNNRGAAKGDLGDYKGMEEDLNEAIKLDPENATLFCNRGLARMMLGCFKRSVESFDEALRLKPKYSAALNNRGNAKGQLDDFKGMLDDCNKAVEMDLNAEAFVSRGGVSLVTTRVCFKIAMRLSRWIQSMSTHSSTAS